MVILESQCGEIIDWNSCDSAPINIKWKMDSLMLKFNSDSLKILSFPIQPCYFYNICWDFSKEGSIQTIAKWKEYGKILFKIRGWGDA